MIEKSSQDLLIPYLLGSIFYFLLFITTSYYARIKGFLSLPFKKFSGIYTSGVDVFFNILFFILSFSSTGFLIALISSKGFPLSIFNQIAIPLFPFAFNICLIYLYGCFNSKFRPKALIKDMLYPGKKSVAKDIRDGFISFLLSLPPLFTFITLSEAILTSLNAQKGLGQDAVNFLIGAKENPISLSIALTTIIIGAPVIEEFLFRAVIQSFLRKKAGAIVSILFTSVFFSVFHFSLNQGFQNIVIIISLFILSIYLGFVYEKTRSLFSSITLHVTFNLINAIKIIFYSS